MRYHAKSAVEVVVAVLFHTEDYYFFEEHSVVIVHTETLRAAHIGYFDSLVVGEEVVKEGHHLAP